MQLPKTITTTSEIIVKFSDCDALQMVWHGNYIKYFEDGREDFSRKFGMSYWDIYKKSGLAVPLIHVDCDYKKFLALGEIATIESTFIDSPAAKILFEYKIFNSKKELACVGKTIQVFVDATSKELVITTPAFYEEWKHNLFSAK